MEARWGVRIAGTGRAVPDKILTNEDLSEIVDTTDEWITERTGIKERRINGRDLRTGRIFFERHIEGL